MRIVTCNLKRDPVSTRALAYCPSSIRGIFHLGPSPCGTLFCPGVSDFISAIMALTSLSQRTVRCGRLTRRFLGLEQVVQRAMFHYMSYHPTLITAPQLCPVSCLACTLSGLCQLFLPTWFLPWCYFHY